MGRCFVGRATRQSESSGSPFRRQKRGRGPLGRSESPADVGRPVLSLLHRGPTIDFAGRLLFRAVLRWAPDAAVRVERIAALRRQEGGRGALARSESRRTRVGRRSACSTAVRPPTSQVGCSSLRCPRAVEVETTAWGGRGASVRGGSRQGAQAAPHDYRPLRPRMSAPNGSIPSGGADHE